MHRLVKLLIFIAVVSASVAASPVVNPSVIFSGGMYTYDYTVQNNTASGLLGFSLTIPGIINSIQSPTGWDGATLVLGTDTLAQWVSLDDPSDIPPSGSLSGFVITSLFPSGTVSFTVLNETFTESSGQTSGPVAPSGVPEPSSATLLLIGSGLLALVFRVKLRGALSWR